MTFDPTFGGSLRIPLIIAPMFLVSNPKMALAACSRGVMGSFPAHSTRTREIFADWIDEMERGVSDMENPAPWAVNLVVHHTNKRLEGDLELCVKHKIPIILTSKGAPKHVFDVIHDYGGIIFHDIASSRHAEIAHEAGADGLIVVCGGAGGHCGTINPFALLNEVRQVTDKPLILSGGLSTGQDILAAQTMGADIVYMGTRFIAAPETLASDEYRQNLYEATSKDVFFTAALDGAPANFLAPSIRAAGIDLDELSATKPGNVVGSDAAKARYSKIFSAGHGVGMVTEALPTAAICDQLIAEYDNAKAAMKHRLAS